MLRRAASPCDFCRNELCCGAVTKDRHSLRLDESTSDPRNANEAKAECNKADSRGFGSCNRPDRLRRYSFPVYIRDERRTAFDEIRLALHIRGIRGQSRKVA